MALGTPLKVDSWPALRRLNARLSNGRRRWLFRGHQDASWHLSSTLERALARFGYKANLMRWFEERLVREFRRHFHRQSSVSIDPSDLTRWLAIMQHHGAPTRFLDCSYSLYVALFFASEKASAGSTSAIWAIDHDWCWDRAKEKLPKGLVRSLEQDDKGFPANNDLLGQDYGCVVPINPFAMDERLAIQQGVFLTSLNLQEPFEATLSTMSRGRTSRRHLLKINVRWRGSFLKETLTELQRMNMTRRTLFPGLDGLAEGLENMMSMRQLFWLHADKVKGAPQR